MSTVGFFGLGVMGAPMAGHPLNAGHRLLTVRHRTPVPATLVAAGRALETARQLGLSLPNTASTQQLFKLCAAQGGQDWDHSALVRALELGAGMDLDGKRQGAAGS